jgi:hypothetical protein
MFSCWALENHGSIDLILKVSLEFAWSSEGRDDVRRECVCECVAVRVQSYNRNYKKRAES